MSLRRKNKMKKLLVLFIALAMVAAFAMPASAFENKFGGYWRIRGYMDRNFTGEDDSESMDVTQIDTRTRLYYTAIFSDNLKFVNKFEMDAVFGADNSYGDVGADGVNVEVKNSYADFNLGALNFKTGVQGVFVSRGFIFDDDMAGFAISYKGEGITVPFVWYKAYEGGYGKDANDNDVDYYGLVPTFAIGDGISLNPFVLYATSEDASMWDSTAAFEELNVWYLGVNADIKMDAVSLWLTGIYEGGDADFVGGGNGDITAYLLAAGASMGVGPVDIHGEVVYATGDGDSDEDLETFFVPQGQSYYWAEIMGYGTFDNQGSANSPTDQIGNIMFANIGASFKPIDKLTLGADLWYAQLAEENAAGDDDLGTELDFSLTYNLVDNLNLDVIAAYLFTGDATYKGDNDENAYELGYRLSLSF
jgi:hypothetical protein